MAQQQRRWCPDVVRLQGAVDLSKMLATGNQTAAPQQTPKPKFKPIETGQRRTASVEQMQKEAQAELAAFIDSMSDEDVEMAYQAAVESGLIESGQ